MRIGSIVEGHGERQAVPLLIRRICEELLGVFDVEVSAPFRSPRSRLLRPGELERAVDFVASAVGEGGGVLLLMDADDDCPREFAPQLLARARSSRPDRVVEVVLANREFEGWFLAAVDSLAGRRTLSSAARLSSDPESVRDAKGWLDARMEDGYQATLDQPAFAAKLDLRQARRRAPSFDKFVRAVAAVIGQPSPPVRAPRR